MKKTETMNNEKIYGIAESLLKEFSNNEEKETFPAIPLFLIRKNIKIFTELAQEIEKTRMDIIQKYGKPSEEDENKFVFEEDAIPKVNEELMGLVNIEQEVSYYTIKLTDISDSKLTSAQMDAIMFFVDYDEGE